MQRHWSSTISSKRMMPFAVLNTYEETCGPSEKFPGAAA
jgi:hypothetical protein